MKKNYFVHPQAIADSKKIGEKTTIWAFSHVLEGASIGSEVNINEHCFVENQVVVGNRVTLKCGVYLWDGITIEDDVFIGPNAVFSNDLYPKSKNKNYQQKKILVKKGASIGGNASILGGVTIGEHALVGLGAVVTKDVHPFTIVVGNPARQTSYVCACTHKLEFADKKETCCPACKKKYAMINNICQLQNEN